MPMICEEHGLQFSACPKCVTERIEKLTIQEYAWAEIINRLACIALGVHPSSNDMDYAQDMIEMVNPYLGLS